MTAALRRFGFVPLLVLCALFSAVLVSVFAGESVSPASGVLRYAGQVIDGDVDARGAPVEMGQPGALAFGAGRLFVASGRGLSVFEPDPDTGELAFVRLVDGHLTDASLAWDEKRSRVIAHNCGVWSAFDVGSGGPAGEAPGSAGGALESLAVAGGSPVCGHLLLDTEGDAAYQVSDSGVDAFVIREDGGLEFDSAFPVSDLEDAVLGESGQVHAAAGFERPVADRIGAPMPDFGEPVATASTPGGRHVYVSTLADGLLLFEALPGVDNVTDDHGDSREAATRVSIPSTTAGELSGWEDRDFFRIRIVSPGTLTLESTGSANPIFGTLQTGNGRRVRFNAYGGEGSNFRIETGVEDDALAAGVYYLWLRGIAATPYELVVSGTARGPATELPAASAPSVSIDAIAAGDESTTVQLGATLTGGTYDGAVEYAWSVDAGALSDPSSATPTWTRPAVTTDTTYTVRLTVTARGRGASARTGSSATANASRVASVRNVAAPLPVASAPSVSIDAIAAGDESTSVGLSATVAGGTYDGSLEYAWTVTGGALNNPSSATPTWTRPSVTTDTTYTVHLAVTARGTGTAARNGTSATANASRVASVRNVAAPLPAASAPSVSIDAIASGDEDTTVQLGASLTGGTYDGSPTYAWTVTGGALNNPSSAAPTWTRPPVSADASYTVRLTVTVTGTGGAARTGTRDTASAVRTAQVRDTAPPPPPPPTSTSCVDDEEWDTVEDYYDVNATKSPNYGANWYRVLIAYQREDPGRTLPAWEGSTAQPTTAYTAEEARDGEAVWFGWTPVREVLECLEAGQPAVAPSVAIDSIAAGDESTAVQLGATLTGGAYDGSPEYDWSVSGGALNDSSLAAPTWTRPSVSANADYTVSLRVTVRGAGANARTGSSATANASRTAEVRDVAALPVADAPSVSIDAIAAGDENTSVQLGATLTGGAYDGSPEYDWSVSGGALNDSSLAAPTWTRPSVGATADYTVSLTVTVRGAGANARTGSSDTANASRTAEVRDAGGDHGGDRASATPLSIPSTTDATLTRGDRDYFRFDITQSGTLTLRTTGSTDTYGTLFDGSGRELQRDDDGGSDLNFRISRGTVAAGTYYLEVRGYNSGTSGDYRLEVSGSARTGVALPAADAPSVTINSIAAGDENTAVQLGASLTGGAYDGSPEYAWTVTGGALNDPASATPTWTRPAVTSDTSYTVRLTLTVQGAGTNAASATSDTAQASRTAQVRDTTAPLPVADAPSVTIGAIAAGDENTAVQLGAALTGGTYDGSPEYAWTVTGGALDNPASANPLWTRPSVSTDTSYTVRLTVTVRGTGANARNATSDTQNASRTALVRDVPVVVLPVADAPSVAINTIAAGDEGTTVQLGATLTGGTYDGSPEYDWSVSGGALNDPSSATPTWTRPSVGANADYTVSLTVTVRGAGTNARTGSSDTANTSRTAQVRDASGDHGDSRATATWVSIPSTTAGEISGRDDYDFFRIEIVSPGTLTLESTGSINPVFANLQDSGGSSVRFNSYGGEGMNFRIETGVDDDALAAGTYYLWLQSYAATAYELVVSGTARGPATGLPAAAAPSVSIDAIAAGDEGTTVQLGATLTGGTYDGAVEYAWSADAGALSDPSSATPTWTRPSVTTDTTYTVRLMVTARGTGTAARNGTSATANASRVASVRNVAAPLPVAAAPAVTIDAIAAGDEGAAVSLGATVTGGLYDGALEYAWSVDAGVLSNPASATPTWTRPSVTTDTNYTVRLTVTAHGTGNTARNGTSATANASRVASVRNVAAPLPVAAAPVVSIDVVAVADEDTTLQLGATLTGGTYDGTPEYSWTADGGSLTGEDTAAPTWKLPAVDSETSYTVRLTVTVHGTGASARDNTSDTASAQAATAVRDTPDLMVTTLVSGLAIPWDLDFTPDGTMLFTERAGKLSSRLTDGTVQTVTADFSDVFNQFESGLMAILVDPDFATNRRFYTCQAHTGPEVQVIAWTINSGYTTATRVADPLVGGIPASTGGRHSGCRLRFGPDGFLWIATGDAATGTAPQDLNSLGGKVLRVNASTGAGATGNPLASAPRIYTYGHRNPQGLALRPGTREMWVVEHGPTRDDEINLLVAGGNYGWDPVHAGDPNNPYFEGVPMTFLQRYPNAVVAKWSSGGSTLAVSGGIFLEGDDWLGWEGRLAVASLKDRSLRLFEFDAGGNLVSEVNIAQMQNTHGRLRTPMLGPDGALYVTTSNGSGDKILRVGPEATTPADAPAVSISVVSAADEGATVQLAAGLTGGTYDGSLEYLWQVTAGALSDPASATPTWTLPQVNALNTRYPVNLAVTARGDGIRAKSGTSNTRRASASVVVRNTSDPLPSAALPVVTIHEIPIGTENTVVRLGTTPHGGAYDELEYAWSVDGGTLNDASAATPKWTRPAVAVNTTSTVRLTLTARGTGTKARNGTSATATASRTANVHDTGTDHGNNSAEATQVTIPAIASGSLDTVSDKDFFRIDVRLAGTLVLQTTGDTDTYGRLLHSDGRVLYLDDDRGSGNNFRIATASLAVGVYYLEVTGHVGALGSYSLSVMGTANDDEGAGAPLVSIDTVPAGLGGATAGLSATLTGGHYDGTPEYAWTVSGGRLDDPASATPTWTRPTVSANATHTVELLLTVRGAGVNAPDGTSDSVSASRSTLVRAAGGDHGNSREHATAVSVPGTESGTLTSGDQDYFSFRLASDASLSIWTTGTTDTRAQLLDRNGVTIAENDDSGAGDNFRMLRDLAAGDYYVRVRGYQPQGGGSAATGPYTLGLGDYPNSRPRIIASRVPGAQQLTAGGAPLLWARPTEAFTDSDDERLWVEPSSSNETVATVALEGASLVVYPHAAGTAIITATARDPSGSSIGASFSVEVNAPTTPTPTASFNAAGDQLTLSFTERFAAGESRAYQARVRQISPRDGIRSFCGTVTNPETTAETENVELDLSPTGFFEPGVEYEAAYRYIGASCSDTRYGRWSAVAEATTPGTASFDIDLVFVGSPPARVRTQVEAAVQTWERVIASSLQDVDFSNNPIPAGYCISGHPAVNDVVDDVRLFLKIESIDGPSGTLANAGACHIRSRSGLPITGRIRLDEADLARLSDAQVRAVVLHEIAHTLGFARHFFYRHSLIRQPSRLIDAETAGSPDTHFAGPLARAAFDAAGGSGYQRRKVPLENSSGGDSHWREDVLDFELMTPRLDAGANPLSAITIQAMADLGYQVNRTPAQSYRLPGNFGSTQLRAQQGEVVREILGTCTVTGTPEPYDDEQENEMQPGTVRIRPPGAQ